MSLPVSKTALDRLGNRLITGGQVDEADRVTLAQVADTYQQALDEAKARLEGWAIPPPHESRRPGLLLRSFVAKLRCG
jgi:hypothetical protein